MKKQLLSEQELIELLKAKQKKGFDYLYNHYALALYAIALKIVHDQAIAQDILQDSFVKIWQHAAEYDASKGRLFTWILNVVRNTAIDRTRSLSYKNDFSALRIDNECKRVDKLFYTEMKIDTIDLVNNVAKLQADQKQIIDYVYLKGYTHAQAAEQLQIPLGTVKTRIKSAICSLKAQLQQSNYSTH